MPITVAAALAEGEASRRRTVAGVVQKHALLVLGLACGAVLRILILRSAAGRPDSDEAVGILMARHLAHGEFQTFFWGQSYGGTLSALVEAPLIRLVGHPLAVAPLATTAMTLACAVVLRSIGRRVAGDLAGDMAAIGFCLSPAVWLAWSTRDYTFWIPGLLVALLTVLACLRWDEGRADHRLWPIGLFAGLSFWANPLLGCIIPPALAAVMWANRHRFAALLKMFALAPVGAAPWLLTNLGHGFSSLHQPTAAEGFVRRAGHAITVLAPIILIEGNGFVQSATVHAAAGWAVTAAAALFVVVQARRGAAKLALVGVPVLVWPLLLAASRVPVPPAAYRYAFLLLPSLALMVGWAVSTVRWKVARPAIAVSVAVLAVAAAVRVFEPATEHFRATAATDPALVPLIGYLESNGLTHVYANYWIAYVLTLDTGEQITASDPQPKRYLPYATAARAASGSTFIYKAGYFTDSQLRHWISSHHEGRRVPVGVYAVYRFDRRVDPGELPLFIDP